MKNIWTTKDSSNKAKSFSKIKIANEQYLTVASPNIIIPSTSISFDSPSVFNLVINNTNPYPLQVRIRYLFAYDSGSGDDITYEYDPDYSIQDWALDSDVNIINLSSSLDAYDVGNIYMDVGHNIQSIDELSLHIDLITKDGTIFKLSYEI